MEKLYLELQLTGFEVKTAGTSAVLKTQHTLLLQNQQSEVANTECKFLVA